MKQPRISRRRLVTGSLMAAAAGGTATFFGPWQHNRVWAQGAKKPIKLGLTCDASGQFGNSGRDDVLGIRLAIDEFNARGGVLGRPIEHKWEDTETDASVAVRKAQRLLPGAVIHSVEGAGHLVPLEKPEEVGQLIRRFLEKVT